ncbi:ParB/Srx family N-terminal domain-containing protein [Verminephrobacter aporrectodeae]|uniref:ParB/Srx family N-terminal domain-containing protein n=1 Tax=Verminephrobacter aporrectodeae TaxID=1110389 RepID=UPI002244733A|nr:ParB/Srx family N-terminal domain-containing protein [Verminephrobacter aporrectodeae]
MTNNAINTPDQVPMGKTTKVSCDYLKLDHGNPRLVAISACPTDEKIIAQLYRGEELEELLQSIAANGYIDIEPLIVWLDPSDQKFTVLEGNRRLAAIRLFREPGLVQAIAKDGLKISVPAISADKMESLSAVSVYSVPDRDAARSFIGFKHINGAAKWESYAKAKFAAAWYRSGNTTLEEIAGKIGDKHDTIKRMVSAIYVLEQAEHGGIFSLSDRKTTKFNFSHLYTALSRTDYMDYLGLKTAWSRYDPQENPVPADKLDRLRKVLVWIYGSKEDDKDSVIQSQNPDLKNLGETLASAEGQHMLLAGRPLAEAYASTRPADEVFSSALIRARNMLRDAANSLRGYDGRDQSLLNVADDIFVTAKIVRDKMKEEFNTAIGGSESGG